MTDDLHFGVDLSEIQDAPEELRERIAYGTVTNMLIETVDLPENGESLDVSIHGEREDDRIEFEIEVE